MKKLECKWSYRISIDLANKLDKLKDYNYVESKFVRAAIEEKLQREVPNLKIQKHKSECPF